MYTRCSSVGDLKREKDLWQQAAYKLANKAGDPVPPSAPVSASGALAAWPYTASIGGGAVSLAF